MKAVLRLLLAKHQGESLFCKEIHPFFCVEELFDGNNFLTTVSVKNSESSLSVGGVSC